MKKKVIKSGNQTEKETTCIKGVGFSGSFFGFGSRVRPFLFGEKHRWAAVFSGHINGHWTRTHRQHGHEQQMDVHRFDPPLALDWSAGAQLSYLDSTPLKTKPT